MVLLVILAFWLMIQTLNFPRRENLFNFDVILAMAAATLTKGLPALLVPIFLKRWRWKWSLLYLGIIFGTLSAFAIGAGWGIIGPLNGVGVFGAMRIFMSWWNFNSSIYHWLEVGLSGYRTPGAVPIEAVGQEPILIARLLTSSVIILVSLLTGWWAWRMDSPQRANYLTRTLTLIRLSVIPIGTYLLITHTVHPWYVVFILPFLPFLLPRGDEVSQIKRFIWPWLYLSIAIALSYLTYFDPNDLREYDIVRLLEYIPVFILLIWAGWPWIHQGFIFIFDRGMRWERIKRR
jgi:hypothetical protein